jgi:hypothetical protein
MQITPPGFENSKKSCIFSEYTEYWFTERCKKGWQREKLNSNLFKMIMICLN